MDFSTRGNQQSPAAPRPGTTFNGDSPAAAAKSSNKRFRRGGKWGKWGALALLVATGVLLLAVIGVMVTANSNKEAGYVDESKLQAVFLTNDQVYFGDITALNSRYIALSNIYYLQTQGTGTTTTATANNNVSLVKLGCELHKPYDKMIINRAEVQFWENLQDDGQVANAVKEFVKQNPNGQKCSTATGGSTTNVQGSGASTTPTTGTTNNDQ